MTNWTTLKIEAQALHRCAKYKKIISGVIHDVDLKKINFTERLLCFNVCYVGRRRRDSSELSTWELPQSRNCHQQFVHWGKSISRIKLCKDLPSESWYPWSECEPIIFLGCGCIFHFLARNTVECPLLSILYFWWTAGSKHEFIRLFTHLCGKKKD